MDNLKDKIKEFINNTDIYVPLICIIVPAIGFAIILILTMVYRFQNPKLTETELMMYNFSKFGFIELILLGIFIYGTRKK